MARYYSKKPLTSAGILILALVAGFSFWGCHSSNSTASDIGKIVEYDGFVMGTSYHIKVVVDPADSKHLDAMKKGIQASLDRIDHMMSTYKPDSELSKFNQSEVDKWFKLSDDTFKVISMAQKLAEESNGLYDITVGPLVNLWGFGPDKRPTSIPTQATLQHIIDTKVGYKYLSIDDKNHSIKKSKPLYLDLSSIAKGYGVDSAAQYLTSQGAKSFLVEVGGEVKTLGVKPDGQPWHLAIEAPTYNERKVYKIIALSGHGLATSGDYRNYYDEDGKRFSHTINPLTGYPVQHKLASASVISPTTAQADAYATAFMVMGTNKAYDFAIKRNIPAFFIYREDNKFKSKYTPAFKSYLIKE
jgi:thiamine biosynthesis lipoprotein